MLNTRDPKSSHHLLSLHYPSLSSHFFCVLVRFVLCVSFSGCLVHHCYILPSKGDPHLAYSSLGFSCASHQPWGALHFQVHEDIDETECFFFIVSRLSHRASSISSALWGYGSSTFCHTSARVSNGSMITCHRLSVIDGQGNFQVAKRLGVLFMGAPL